MESPIHIHHKKTFAEQVKKLIKKVDFCSYVPDFKHMKPCCKNHDDDYKWQIGKWLADWKFVKCGWKNAGNLKYPITAKTIAVGYYVGVTLFGWLPYYKSGKELIKGNQDA